MNKIGIKPPEKLARFFVKLNEANLITRYPEDIDILQKEYTEVITSEIVSNSEEAIAWIKTKF
ncbi:MAG: hypothetical protein N3A72_02805 [bacterium]|nr:hypothetical protein [bacterium]